MQEQHMHVDTYERWWIMAVFAVLGIFFGALLAGLIVAGVSPPGPGGFINPLALDDTEFAQPGVRHMGGNQYEVYVLAQMWSFTPGEIRIPVGSEVTFVVTSADVVHGFYIERQNVNIEVVPGHVGRITATFNERGEFRLLCHEYCGRGHHLMHAAVIVE